VGDRCGAGGNDKELYDKLQPDHSYSTSSPNRTIKIVESIIDKIVKEKNT
jgi:hypothetical protein